MQVGIPYGKDCIKLNINDSNVIDVIKSKDIKKSFDENKIILKALSSPIGSKKLAELAREKNNSCILVSDITRPCPSYKFLPYIIDELKTGGVKEITIIFGLGIHRSHSQEERLKLIGDYVAGSANLLDFEEDKCKFVGKTKYSTPVEIYSRVLDADLLIATGNIEYHYFAGYSGGAKALMPGICSRNSIRANHLLMLDDASTAGNFYTNPVRLDIEEAGAMVGIDYIFNVILDDSKNIIAAVSGANNNAFIEGIKIYDSIYKMEVDSKADMVITSPGGHPKDINLYQAQKALESVKEIVKEDGVVVLVAACPEEFGEDTFARWMDDAKDYKKLYKKLKDKFILGGHKAVAISKLLTKFKVYLYSLFDKETTESMGFIKLDDIQKYIDYVIKKNNETKITIVPNGRFLRYKNC